MNKNMKRKYNIKLIISIAALFLSIGIGLIVFDCIDYRKVQPSTNDILFSITGEIIEINKDRTIDFCIKYNPYQANTESGLSVGKTVKLNCSSVKDSIFNSLNVNDNIDVTYFAGNYNSDNNTLKAYVDKEFKVIVEDIKNKSLQFKALTAYENFSVGDVAIADCSEIEDEIIQNLQIGDIIILDYYYPFHTKTKVLTASFIDYYFTVEIIENNISTIKARVIHGDEMFSKGEIVTLDCSEYSKFFEDEIKSFKLGDRISLMYSVNDEKLDVNNRTIPSYALQLEGE